MTNRAPRVIILGLGGRGRHYLDFSLDEGLEVVAVAERDAVRRADVLASRGLDIPNYGDWAEALQHEADACVVALPDTLHVAPTLAALDAGLHVLCEKPMATTLEDCLAMVEAAERVGRLLMICHVLRYAPFFEAIRAALKRGDVGRLLHIQMTENVGWWHFAHSFVRGPFRNTQVAAPFILAKSCHDLDLIHWMTGQPAESVMSEGSLSYYKPENAPEGAPKRCLDGCPAEATCPWFAPRLYLKQISAVGWPSTSISVDTSLPARIRALQEGPFGRCVYHSDNDVNDQQSAIFLMRDGVQVTFNMTGFSSENTRSIRLHGSHGDIVGKLDSNELTLTRFDDDQLTPRPLAIEPPGPTQSGHGGGDRRLFRDFAAALRDPDVTSPGTVRTAAREALESHLMAFAAERSRAEGRRVMIDELRPA